MSEVHGKPHVQVAAGLIFKEGKVLITKRPEGTHLAGCWEFPGGKKEPHETLPECLEREIREELGISVRAEAFICRVDHDYESVTISLHLFRCSVPLEEPRPIGCEAWLWVRPEDLGRYPMPPADQELLNLIMGGGWSMNMQDLVSKTRSCRRFVQDHRIQTTTLRNLVDLARLSASAANLQPLKYILSNEDSKNQRIFSCLRWAIHLKGWDGPAEGERPSAYIIVLGDRQISPSFGCDHGIASQNILLGATGMGLAGCIIGAVDRRRLRKDLSIPERYEVLHVIALGKAGEKIVIETVGPDGDVRYWRDESSVHHVPKRALDDIILS